MCRQKDIINLRSGLIIKTLDDFVKTKHYVTASISHNEKYILIGEENVSRRKQRIIIMGTYSEAVKRKIQGYFIFDFFAPVKMK